MPKFRKKPVVIHAVQWKKDNFESEFIPLVILAHEISGEAEHYTLSKEKELTIHTLEGDHLANVGDWIIVGVKGEMYPCKPDIFEMTYEPVPHDA
jgi:hypothetical protein